jgi:hypothetical protein
MMCTVWPLTSPAVLPGSGPSGLVGVIVGRHQARISRLTRAASRKLTSCTYVRGTRTPGLQSLLLRLGLARSVANRGVCSSAAILLPSMACSAGGPLRRRHRVIALLADRQGRSRVVRSTSSFVAGIDRVRRSSENTASGDVGSARTISESSSHVVEGPGH